MFLSSGRQIRILFFEYSSSFSETFTMSLEGLMLEREHCTVVSCWLV